MFSKISLGRYYPAHSFLHETDPRVKTILYAVYLVAIFIIQEPVAIGILGGIIILQLILAKITPGILWSTVKPMIPLALFIFVINIFTIKQGNVLFSWKIITITDYGIGKAVIMAVRLIFLIVSTSILLTLTTTPLKMSDALEKLFAPLSIIKVPVHEFAMMMTIALRFIPTLVDETEKIINAQKARGADFETGNLLKRAKALIPIMVPLIVSSFRRAEELADAMECRCYHGGEGRTRYKVYSMGVRDAVAFFAVAVIFTLIILTNVYF